MNKLALTIPSEMGSVSKVENFIEFLIEQFQLPPSVNGKITLSVIEAVHNSIRQQTKPTKEGKVNRYQKHSKGYYYHRR